MLRIFRLLVCPFCRLFLCTYFSLLEREVAQCLSFLYTPSFWIAQVPCNRLVCGALQGNPGGQKCIELSFCSSSELQEESSNLRDPPTGPCQEMLCNPLPTEPSPKPVVDGFGDSHAVGYCRWVPCLTLCGNRDQVRLLL